VAATGVTMTFADIGASPALFAPAQAIVRADRIQGFVCVPVNSRGRILGTLSLGRQTDVPFDEPEIALLEATADQVGIALDNARLYSESVRQLEELRLKQAQLVHAEKLSAVGELASGVAHEINNPLTTILGQAQLLMDRRDIAPDVRERIKTSPTRPRGPRASCKIYCCSRATIPPSAARAHSPSRRSACWS